MRDDGAIRREIVARIRLALELEERGNNLIHGIHFGPEPSDEDERRRDDLMRQSALAWEFAAGLAWTLEMDEVMWRRIVRCAQEPQAEAS